MAEPTLQPTIHALLKKYGGSPQKRFGQNFLVSKRALLGIVDAANIEKTDVILEVGPGLGVLTLELAKRAKRVIAVEKDRVMVQILRNILKQEDISNVEVVQKDARDIGSDDFKNWKLEIRNYKVVANLPYYIATPIIRKFLEIDTPPETMVLTIQKEVAQRICAKPPRMNVLALSVQLYADPKIIAVVPNTDFWPKPDVDGTVIKIVLRKERPNKKLSNQFFKVIKAGFSQPRKKFISNLEHTLSLPKEKIQKTLRLEGIPEDARAQHIELAKWISVTKNLCAIERK